MSYPSPTLRKRAERLAHAAIVTSVAVASLSATAYDVSLTAAPNAAVPDGNLSGLASTLHVPAGGIIRDIDLSLDLPGDGHGGWNGDLHVLLSHGGVASVLVNRPGRTAGNPFGYGDNGLVGVTFDDEAGSGDFHIYQQTLGLPGDSASPLGGSWQPDARAIDPSTVVTSDARSAFLSVFDGLDAAGEWVLLVTDVSTGGRVTLDRWTLNITFDSGPKVPDSSHGVLLLGGLTVAGLAWLRRRGPSEAPARCP